MSDGEWAVIKDLNDTIRVLRSQLTVAEQAHRVANAQMLQAWRDRDAALAEAQSLRQALALASSCVVGDISGWWDNVENQGRS